jgi:3-isopropylmalate/(R)-2-methylmalate dehydratase small subunit
MLQPFTLLTAKAVPLEVAKIDTGMILPGRFMRLHRRPGHDYSNAFLHDLRFDEKGVPRPDFSLNQPAYKDALIVVAGADFGCGSSREGAAFAVKDYGFRAMIAPSFAEIFYGNCLQNGILPVVLEEDAVADIWRQLREKPGVALTIDLPNQVVIDADGNTHGFDINPLRKDRLVNGIDDIDVTMQHGAAIETFETKRRQAFPWLPLTAGV